MGWDKMACDGMRWDGRNVRSAIEDQLCESVMRRCFSEERRGGDEEGEECLHPF